MIEILHKTFTASMPLNAYDDERLKLVVYGSAYIEIMRLKEYSVINIEENFYNNYKAECRTLHIMIDLQKELKKGELN